MTRKRRQMKERIMKFAELQDFAQDIVDTLEEEIERMMIIIQNKEEEEE